MVLPGPPDQCDGGEDCDNISVRAHATWIHLVNYPRNFMSKYVAGEGSRLPGHDAPALQSTACVGGRAARCYHLVAVTPLDLGAMLTADRP